MQSVPWSVDIHPPRCSSRPRRPPPGQRLAPKSGSAINNDRFLPADRIRHRIKPLSAARLGTAPAQSPPLPSVPCGRPQACPHGPPLARSSGTLRRGGVVFQRFCHRIKRGIFNKIVKVLSEESDREYVLIDGTIVMATRKPSVRKGHEIEGASREWPSIQATRKFACAPR